MGFFEALFYGAGGGGVTTGWREAAAAAAWAMLVAGPMVHFLTFYAFWHCVCMGLAELTGYPDRFLYGEGTCVMCWDTFCFLPLLFSVVCPTGPHPPLQLATRPNRGHMGGGGAPGWTPSCGM